MIYDQELPVASPRARNPQLSEKGSATSGGGDATASATTDLKTLANRYLERKKCNPPCNSHATEAQKPMQLSGAPEAAKVAYAEAPEAYSEEVPNWLGWIGERCPLLSEDCAHVARGLYQLHPRLQRRLAERYAETWHTAANNERNANKRDNAGRRAANLIITQLLKGNGYV